MDITEQKKKVGKRCVIFNLLISHYLTRELWWMNQDKLPLTTQKAPKTTSKFQQPNKLLGAAALSKEKNASYSNKWCASPNEGIV
jgi:hypothetical protein